MCVNIWLSGCHGDGQAHLFVHEDVDDGVDDGAGLGEEGRHHAGHQADEARPAERRHHGYDSVRQPAKQEANHRGEHHEQDVELSAPRRRAPDTTHLTGNRKLSYLSDPPDRKQEAVIPV